MSRTAFKLDEIRQDVSEQRFNIPIGQQQAAKAGGRQVDGCRAAEPPEAHHQYRGGGQSLLPGHVKVID